MHDDDDFLRKLLENPADDTVRLVYADWLDERGDEESKEKSQFLRLTVQSREEGGAALDAQMQALAARLPTEWLAVVSRLRVEGCAAKAEEYQRKHNPRFIDVKKLFEFVCDQEWDEMTPTEDDGVRRCERCQENVHYCDTLAVAREHALKRQCVALDLGIIRRPDDLSPRYSWRGKIRPGAAQEEEERLKLDAVSLEREERKRNT